MPQVLEDLADARTVVIVTSSPAEVVEGWLRTHEVHGVAEVAGAETARSKVEKIHALLARFPGQEVYWYVGDTAGDIREAREAGVTPRRRRLGVARAGDAASRPAPSASPPRRPSCSTIIAPELAGDFFGAG